ncbi:hypothetical protein [Candidatus Symbiopectobacterium sp.]|nr:hypothetical protein [Candidatus Symbiopectobacterium sp.]
MITQKFYLFNKAIAQIKMFAVVNFLPALLFIIPLSIYWHRWFV